MKNGKTRPFNKKYALVPGMCSSSLLAITAWKDVAFPDLPSQWKGDPSWLSSTSLGDAIAAAAAVTPGVSSSASQAEGLAGKNAATSSATAQQLLDWHLANLEYANGVRLQELSLAYWDDDDPWEFRGSHALLPSGFSALCEGLAARVGQLRLGAVVERVEYGESDDEKVKLHCRSQEPGEKLDVIEADVVIVTVPLGVLKVGVSQQDKRQRQQQQPPPGDAQEVPVMEEEVLIGGLEFDPPLSGTQADAVRRLGFGLLNKVVLHFPSVFWATTTPADAADAEKDGAGSGSSSEESGGKTTDMTIEEASSDDDEEELVDDMIGRLCADESRRGEYFQLISMARASGEATLVALVAGNAAEEQEERTDEEVTASVMQALRSIFGAKPEDGGAAEAGGVVSVPEPLNVEVSRWRADPYSRGSYSYQAVGSSPADREALAGNDNSVAKASVAAAIAESKAAATRPPEPQKQKRKPKRRKVAASPRVKREGAAGSPTRQQKTGSGRVGKKSQAAAAAVAERAAASKDPTKWEAHTDEARGGLPYWWNTVTGESRWTNPADAGTSLWEKHTDESRGGKVYWWNNVTYESRWTDPEAGGKEKKQGKAGKPAAAPVAPVDLTMEEDEVAGDRPAAAIAPAAVAVGKMSTPQLPLALRQLRVTEAGGPAIVEAEAVEIAQKLPEPKQPAVVTKAEGEVDLREREPDAPRSAKRPRQDEQSQSQPQPEPLPEPEQVSLRLRGAGELPWWEDPPIEVGARVQTTYDAEGRPKTFLGTVEKVTRANAVPGAVPTLQIRFDTSDVDSRTADQCEAAVEEASASPANESESSSKDQPEAAVAATVKGSADAMDLVASAEAAGTAEAAPSGEGDDANQERGGNPRVLIAGEATCATHPATAHGAFLSGLAAAAKALLYTSEGQQQGVAAAALEALAAAHAQAVATEKAAPKPRRKKGRKGHNW